MVTHRQQDLQQRFRRAVAFLKARVSPEGLYGLYFTAGILVLAGATWLFGAISEDLITGDPLVAVDKVISEVFRYLANPQFTAAMQFASSFAAASTIGVLFALFGGMFCLQAALVLVLGMGSGRWRRHPAQSRIEKCLRSGQARMGRSAECA